MIEIIDDAKIRSIADDYPCAIEGERFLKNLICENFPFGYNNIPDEITLMKILYLKNEIDLDENRLSKFYFTNEDNIENMRGILDGAKYEGAPYLIKVKTKSKNIDIEETLRDNLLYQFEYGTVLKQNAKICLIKIEKL